LGQISGSDDRAGYSGTRAAARQVKVAEKLEEKTQEKIGVKAGDFTVPCGEKYRSVSTAGKMRRQRARKRAEAAATHAAGAGIGRA
jgi:hypothetical protein